MIDIEVYQNTQNEITECRLCGHADYANHGEDIVCAAISAITCTAVLGLREYAKVDGHYEALPAKAHIKPNVYRDDAVQAILQTLVLGYREIANQYSQYITITIHRR